MVERSGRGNGEKAKRLLRDGVSLSRRELFKRTGVLVGVPVLASATSGTAAAASGTLRNDVIEVDVNTDGTFQLRTVDDEQLTYPRAGTSGLTVQVGGTNYVLGTPEGRSIDSYRTQDTQFSDDETTATTEWELPESVRVTQTLSLAGDAVRFDLTATNTGTSGREVNVRYLHDYQVGPQDGAPIFVDGDVLTTETRFESPTFDTWQTYDQLPDPSLTGHGTHGTTPDRIEFVWWPRASDSGYAYPGFDPDQQFYTSGATSSPDSDSAGLLYYELGTLAADESETVTTYYGAGDPSEADVSALDDALVEYRDAVTAYVDDVVGAHAGGYASQYLREEADQGYPNLTGSDDRSEAFRNTVVKFFEYRAGIADDSEIDPGYFDAIRSLADTIPEELPDEESAGLFRFTDEMFEAVPAGAPDEVREEAEATFEDHFLGEADQDDPLTIGGRTLGELRDAFATEFDAKREQFIQSCEDADIGPAAVDALVRQVTHLTEALEERRTRKVSGYSEVIGAAVDGEQVASTAEVMQTGGAVGSVVGGTIGLGAGLLIAGPTGEEPALIGIGTSVGSAVGATAGGLIAPVLTDGQVGGNQWDSSFVGTETWNAIAGYELQWLYNLKRAPARILPAGVLNHAGGDFDAQTATTPERLFELGCEAAVERLDLGVRIADVSVTAVTADDQIGESSFAAQDGAITVENPESNGMAITPAFLRDECSLTAHTTAKQSTRGFLTLPPRSELPEIAPGETAEIPFSYVTPLESNADYEAAFRVKPTPVSTTIRGASEVVPHDVGTAGAVETSALSDGQLVQGESATSSVTLDDASQSVFNLSYSGSDLDLHVYDDGGNHVGMNYDTGEYETQIPGVTPSGPDDGAGFESVRVEDPAGSYESEVVAVSTPDGGSSYSVTNASSDSLPASVAVRPSPLGVSVAPGAAATAELTVSETAGDQPLSGVSVRPQSVTHREHGSQLDGSHLEAERSDFEVPAGGQEQVSLSVDVPESAASGRYDGRLEVVTEGDARATVPVSLTVTGPRTDAPESTTEAEEGPSGPLGTAIRSVPDAGFVGDPATRRQRLLETAASFEAAMADGDRERARTALDDLEANVDAWLRDDYATSGDQYSKQEVLAVVADQRSRLDTDDGLSAVELGALGAAGVGSLGYVLYRYGHLRGSATADDDPADNLDKRGSVPPSVRADRAEQATGGGDRSRSDPQHRDDPRTAAAGTPAAADDAATGAPAGDSTAEFCPNCGTAVDPDWQFCEHCGTDRTGTRD